MSQRLENQPEISLVVEFVQRSDLWHSACSYARQPGDRTGRNRPMRSPLLLL
jgi:hypothetical protein